LCLVQSLEPELGSLGLFCTGLAGGLLLY
jgi:hypothetical protein